MESKKRNYYFCACNYLFGKDCQVVSVWNNALAETAKRWKETNGYKHCYVYDMEHNYVWDF